MLNHYSKAVHFIWPLLSPILARFEELSLGSVVQSCPDVSWMLKVQLLKLPIVAPERKPDPTWTGFMVADSTLVTEEVGRVVVSVRVEMLAGRLLLERLSARDIHR